MKSRSVLFTAGLFVVVFLLVSNLPETLLKNSPLAEVTQQPVQADVETDPIDLVGYLNLDGRQTFIRVAPLALSEPVPLFHMPQELAFSRSIEDLMVSTGQLQLTVPEADGLSLNGTWNGEGYVGIFQSKQGSGTFALYPLTGVNNAVFAAYVGSYSLPDGTLRHVSFEDFAGIVPSRLYYSTGANWVALYPIADDTYLTAFGERIQFTPDAMQIAHNGTELTAPRVMTHDETELEIAVDGAVLSGSLLTPLTPGPHPTVIVTHSSANGERNAYRLYAENFLAKGIAVFLFDRRGHGKSTGEWPMFLDTSVLAADLLAVYETVQVQPQVDAEHVGLFGLSNGSWVASLAATDIPDLDFLVVSGASAVSQTEAELYRQELGLRSTDLPEEKIQQAMALWQQYYAHIGDAPLTGSDWQQFVTDYESLAADPAFANLGGFRLVITDIPLEEIERSAASRGYFSFSPSSYYEQTDVPVLFFIGEYDSAVPPQLTTPRMQSIVAGRPDADITFIQVPEASHGIFPRPLEIDGMNPELFFLYLSDYTFSEGYIQTMQAWMVKRTTD